MEPASPYAELLTQREHQRPMAPTNLAQCRRCIRKWSSSPTTLAPSWSIITTSAGTRYPRAPLLIAPCRMTEGVERVLNTKVTEDGTPTSDVVAVPARPTQ